MKLNLKSLFALFAAAAIGAPSIRAASDPAASTAKPPKIEDLFPDQVIAKGKGFEIKQSELDEVVTGLRSRMRAGGQEIPEPQIPALQRDLLDNMIQMRILNLQATDEQKAKGKDDAAHDFDMIRKRLPSDEALALQLKSVGMSTERLRTRLVEEATAKIVIRPKLNVTDEDVKKFYDENPSQFEQPDLVRLSHILLVTHDKAGADLPDEEKKTVRKQADSLLKRARDGEDFTKLAKEFSNDPDAKETGGEITIPRSSLKVPTRVPPEFESAAFALETNQISGVIVSPIGFHIIKSLEKTPAHRLEFDKVNAAIRANLEKQAAEKILPKYYAQLKKDWNVEIVDPQLKELEKAADAAAAPPATTNK